MYSQLSKVTYETHVFLILDTVRGVRGVKVNTSVFISRIDGESQMSYTQGSNWQRFRIYEFLKYIK